MEYKSKTDEELKQLAKDVQGNLVFTSEHISKNEPQMMSMVFMPLSFMDDDTRQELVDAEISLLYEYIEKAGPRSVNGYPMFTSVRMLNKEDATKMWQYYQKMVDAADNI